MTDVDACVKMLSTWIVEFKRNTWTEYVKTSDDANELQTYRDVLQQQEGDLRKAINSEDTNTLSNLGWPDELMECIQDMGVRTELIDILYESLFSHPFNRSPQHEDELNNETSGLSQ
jgi:hypothetical protein